MEARRLGERVRALREAHGLTQTELAARAGVGQRTLSSIEIGHTQLPGVNVRHRLAATLNTTHVDLLVAAGEVSYQELEDWARTAGFVRPDASEGGWVEDLMREAWRPGNPRGELAREIMRMTLDEASFLLEVFRRLPTIARRKRQELSAEAYLEWRLRADAEGVL